MNFHLDFGKEDVRPGTYIFEGKAVLKEDEQQVWPFKQELPSVVKKPKIK